MNSTSAGSDRRWPISGSLTMIARMDWYRPSCSGRCVEPIPTEDGNRVDTDGPDVGRRALNCVALSDHLGGPFRNPSLGAPRRLAHTQEVLLRKAPISTFSSLILLIAISVAGCTSSQPSNSVASSRASSWSWLGEKNTATHDGEIAAVSCSSATLCVAVGWYVPYSNSYDLAASKGDLAASFNGRSWSPDHLLGETLPPCPHGCAAPCLFHVCALQGKGLTAVSCTGPSFCMAIDTVSQSFSFDGRHWSQRPLNFGLSPAVYQETGSSLSCSSSVFCMAANNIGIVDTFDGQSWGPPTHPLGMQPVLGNVWCRDDHECDLVSFNEANYPFYGNVSRYDSYRYDGSAWLPLSPVGGSGIPCLAADTCFFADGALIPLPPIGGWFSCASKSFCMAVTVGNGVAQSSVYSDNHWSTPQSVPHAHSLASDVYDNPFLNVFLACASSRFCILVTGNGQTWLWRHE
jgi:hypothetical protein